MPVCGRDSPRGRPFSKIEKSPAKKPSSNFESRQPTRAPATSHSRESSQDSSARAHSQDPEDIIAANRQFGVPLSELGRVDLSAHATADALNKHRSSMVSLPIPGGPIVTGDQGTVLVEATPSNSASSQSQQLQHPWQETQLISQHYPVPRAGDAQSDGYESSDSFGMSLMKPSLTQLSPQQTQEVIQTQPADDVATGPTETTNATSANAIGLHHRHLGRMAANPFKYVKYKDQLPNLAPTSNSGTSGGQQQRTAQPWIETQPTAEEDHRPGRHWVDTQPTTEEDHRTRSNWVDTQPTAVRNLPPAPQWVETQPTTEEDLQPPPRPNFALPHLPRKIGPQPIAPDSPTRVLTDVVPDSEPIQSSPLKPQDPTGTESEEEQRPRKRPKTIAKSRVNLNGSDGEDEDNNLQPSTISPSKAGKRQGSGDSSESEDDTPLAVNIARKGRKGKEVVRPHRTPKVPSSKVRRP